MHFPHGKYNATPARLEHTKRYTFGMCAIGDEEKNEINPFVGIILSVVLIIAIKHNLL